MRAKSARTRALAAVRRDEVTPAFVTAVDAGDVDAAPTPRAAEISDIQSACDGLRARVDSRRAAIRKLQEEYGAME